MRRFRPLPVLLTTCCLQFALMLNAAPTSAQTGTPAMLTALLPDFRPAGQGAFRWFGLKLYDATFWVGEHGYDPRRPMAYPFALELQYALKLKGARIAQASIEEMRKLPGGDEAPFERWRGMLETLFPDVPSGSRITAVHLPRQAARFFLDGVAIGQIQDAELERRFFAIWLDPGTSAPALREALLKNSAAWP